MSILLYALGSVIGGLLALGVGWLLVNYLIWPWLQRHDPVLRGSDRPQSAMFSGDVQDIVIIDCEGRQIIHGSAKTPCEVFTPGEAWVSGEGLQAAIDAAEAGSTIYTDYVIDQTIRMKSGVRLVGVSAEEMAARTREPIAFVKPGTRIDLTS
jgi:hypothetical protein